MTKAKPKVEKRTLKEIHLVISAVDRIDNPYNTSDSIDEWPYQIYEATLILKSSNGVDTKFCNRVGTEMIHGIVTGYDKLVENLKESIDMYFKNPDIDMFLNEFEKYIDKKNRLN